MAEILYTKDIVPVESRTALTTLEDNDTILVHDTSALKIKKITKSNLKEDLGINDKADKATSVVSYTASHTLALTDAYKMLKITSTSDLTITVPTNSSVAFDTNTEIVVVRYGTGAVTFASSATIHSESSKLSINAQYQSVTLKKIDTDEWLLIGALS